MYQAISEYIEYLELEKGLAQNTIDAYRRDLEYFADYSGVNSGIADISGVDRLSINSYIRELREKGLAPTSIIRKVASLRGFFKWANSSGLISKNPAATLEQFRKGFRKSVR